MHGSIPPCEAIVGCFHASPMQVLVIEDDVETLDYIAQGLEQAGPTRSIGSRTASQGFFRRWKVGTTHSSSIACCRV